MRTLFHGGRVETLDGSADWLLVEDDHIAALGSGEPPAGDNGLVVSMDGLFLLPAFRDAHVHLPATGLYASGFDFRGERSADAILDAYASRKDGDAILFGGNFEDPLDKPLLARDLDDAVGDRPALLARADMHSAIVSTALLQELDLESVEGVDRNEDGEPTGYLREQAAAAAWTWFDGNLTPEQQRDAVEAAARLAYSKGVAEVHEMFVVEWRGWDSATAFIEIMESLPLRVQLFLGTDEVARVADLGFPRMGGDYFLDGSFGSHTAWLRAPYASSPPSGSAPTGISYRDDAALHHLFRAAQEAGMQMGVHAIGDAAIEQAIETWERVARDVGIDDVRALGHRIEHFECAEDDHIERAVALGLVASVQPAFDRYWGGHDGLYAERIGAERALRMNRFRTMLDMGLPLLAGSDSTVTPLDPFLQIASLRDHHVADESLDAHTALLLHSTGPLVEGGPADLVVLDRNPLEADPKQLLETTVRGTWIDGRCVWPQNWEAAQS